MPSPLETALTGLLTTLQGIAGPEVLRNAERPEAVPAGGLLILRDGERIEGIDVLSPHRVLVEHGAEVEAFAADEAARDALCEAVREAIKSDRTLGGAVEDARVIQREDAIADFEGAANIACALLTVSLFFTEEGG